MLDCSWVEFSVILDLIESILWIAVESILWIRNSLCFVISEGIGFAEVWASSQSKRIGGIFLLSKVIVWIAIPSFKWVWNGLSSSVY
jgi:hypothetical protein